MRIKYIDRNFQGISLLIIEHSNAVLEEYFGQGLVVTLRQLYYQFVARDLFPDSWYVQVGRKKTKNHQKNYKKLQSIINDARLAGYIDWDFLEDRTRNLMHWPFEADAPEALSGLSGSYREDLWKDQDYYVEVWVEKDALLGVIEQASQKWRTPYFSCRGYTSQSEVWRASQRFIQKGEAGQRGVIIHLGDHDPSGVDMTRDIDDRLELFQAEGVVVERIALNMDQVRRFNPPPNFAKETDSRINQYRRKYGKQSWELDALEPVMLQRLIERTTESYVIARRWAAAVKKESTAQKQLALISGNYDKVISHLQPSRK